MLVINFHKFFPVMLLLSKLVGVGNVGGLKILLFHFLLFCAMHTLSTSGFTFLLKIFFCANSYPGQEQKFIRYIKEAFLIQRHASEQIKNTENFELFGHKMWDMIKEKLPSSEHFYCF